MLKYSSRGEFVAAILLVLFWFGLGVLGLRRSEMSPWMGHLLAGVFCASFVWPGLALLRRLRRRPSMFDWFVVVLFGGVSLLSFFLAFEAWQGG
jgi:hypothetical protein